MKLLHLSFHTGCQNDIEYICNQLNIDLTFREFVDGISKGNDKYNITHEKAEYAWNKYKDFYNQFDCIITSDTAPISRVFLQNNWKKKLIIWICNRFDYAHQPDAEKIGFPDKEYYDLINDCKNRENVHLICNTDIEYHHLKKRNIICEKEIIKPLGLIVNNECNTKTELPNKNEVYFIPSYHNETIFMNLKEKMNELKIPNYNERHKGFHDLKEFKGVICIPYAYSTWVFFEGIQLGMIYFLPSLQFLKKLSKKGNFWHQNMEYFDKYLHLSEWYCEEHKDILVYFDSWEDLKYKINITNFKLQKQKIIDFALKIKKNNIRKWKILLS